MPRTMQPAKGGKQAVARNSAKREAQTTKTVSTRRTQANHLQGVKLNYDIQKLKHDLKWHDPRFNLMDVVAAVAVGCLFFGSIYSTLWLCYVIAG